MSRRASRENNSGILGNSNEEKSDEGSGVVPIFSRQHTAHLPGFDDVEETAPSNNNLSLSNQHIDVNSHPGSHIIAQSDRSGSQKRIEKPIYDNAKPSRPSILSRFFCCLKENIKTENNTSTNMGASTKTGNVLTPQSGCIKGKKCLVLDLDETLVHSSFQVMSGSDYIIPVAIDDAVHNVFVLKRPGVDQFLQRLGVHYEIIVYTASLSKYADPLLDKLDIHKVINKRLFRESCVFHDGHYVKDLSLLSRNLNATIIVDNSPMSYTFHPDNAIDCGSYIDDKKDVEMWQIADFLEGIKDCDDVRDHCKSWRDWCQRHPSSVPVQK